jgi:hypothetical protein
MVRAVTSLPLLTNSSTKTFRRCNREFFYRYECGYTPVSEDAEALRFGTLVHLALEAWWLAKQSKGLRLVAAFDALASCEDPFVKVRAEELMRGYEARWGGEEYEVLHVEKEFRAPLINPETLAPSRTWQRAGKLDAVVRHPSGRVYVVEHKTAATDITAGSPYWELLRIDSQVSGYLAAGAALGIAIDSCLYDVIGKPALRPYKATPVEDRKYTKPTKAQPEARLYATQREADETPEEYGQRIREHIAENPDRYYQRGEVVRLEDEAAEAAFDVWQTGRNIRDAQIAARWPRNPDSCIRFGRRCSFLDVCTSTADITDPARFARLDNPHREITAA